MARNDPTNIFDDISEENVVMDVIGNCRGS